MIVGGVEPNNEFWLCRPNLLHRIGRKCGRTRQRSRYGVQPFSPNRGFPHIGSHQTQTRLSFTKSCEDDDHVLLLEMEAMAQRLRVSDQDACCATFAEEA